MGEGAEAVALGDGVGVSSGDVGVCDAGAFGDDVGVNVDVGVSVGSPGCVAVNEVLAVGVALGVGEIVAVAVAVGVAGIVAVRVGVDDDTGLGDGVTGVEVGSVVSVRVGE